MFTFSISVKGGANHDPATKRLPAILFRFTRVHQCCVFDGRRYYQDNVYHGMNLFFAILWILSGIFGLLCLVYMIRCVVKKRWRVRDLVLGCLPVCRNLPAPMGTRVECGSDDVDRSFSVLSQEITWFCFNTVTKTEPACAGSLSIHIKFIGPAPAPPGSGHCRRSRCGWRPPAPGASGGLRR